MSGLDLPAVKSVYAALVSHAKSLALFTGGVSQHEPLSPPGSSGLSAAFIEGAIGPAPSGLGATSLKWEWMIRVYSKWLEKPASEIDAPLTAAAVQLFASYAADLDLTGFGVPAGLVREVDVLGVVSEPKWLSMEGTQFRVRDLAISLIINDAYPQAVA